MAAPAPTQRFLFDEKLSQIRSRGIEFHPHLPDDCPIGPDGVPIFGWPINHLLPDHDDAAGILRFLGLNQTTIDQVLALYAKDSEPHIHDGEAVFNRYEHRFPLAKRLFELYAGRRLAEGSHEQSYDGYIIAGIEHGGLAPEFAIWCGLSKDDPRYKDSLMEGWYQMRPMELSYEIVEGCMCRLEELWEGRIRARKDKTSSTEESTTTGEGSTSTMASTTSPSSASRKA